MKTAAAALRVANSQANSSRNSRSARRRRVSSAHFVIAPISRQQQNRTVNDSEARDTMQAGNLLMAIPKRLLKRAVDRNAVRRAAREAWKQSARRTVLTGSALLRLTAKPASFEQASRPQRKRHWREELQDLMDRYAE